MPDGKDKKRKSFNIKYFTVFFFFFWLLLFFVAPVPLYFISNYRTVLLKNKNIYNQISYSIVWFISTRVQHYITIAVKLRAPADQQFLPYPTREFKSRIRKKSKKKKINYLLANRSGPFPCNSAGAYFNFNNKFLNNCSYYSCSFFFYVIGRVAYIFLLATLSGTLIIRNKYCKLFDIVKFSGII